MPNNLARAMLKDIITRVLIEQQGRLITQQAEVIADNIITAGFLHPRVNPTSVYGLNWEIGPVPDVEGINDVKQANELNQFARAVTDSINYRFVRREGERDALNGGDDRDTVQEVLPDSGGREEIPTGRADGPRLDEPREGSE